jgi:hypothetical protein
MMNLVRLSAWVFCQHDFGEPGDLCIEVLRWAHSVHQVMALGGGCVEERTHEIPLLGLAAPGEASQA